MLWDKPQHVGEEQDADRHQDEAQADAGDRRLEHRINPPRQLPDLALSVNPA